MALTPGTRLGPYEITGLLGAGGMGEVYRATDTNLKRQVAIKVLPESVASDPERLARFQREAELLAALNHSNIAHIHGVEHTAGVPALVMELVDGPTVAERVLRSPIPIKEALSVAKQIAEALEAAHDRGIVHRDLKPANIKVTRNGVVKVLDFGLAKAVATESSVQDPSQVSTLTVEGTRAGIILGTAAYMSPEQARGQIVDKRTDIWAFGCVLYEMLSARPAFAGDTISDTIAAILQREPEWDRLPAATSPAVRRLLRRCLEKDPKRRLRDIGDARIGVEDAQEESSQGAAAVAARGSRLPWWAVNLVVVGVAVGATATVASWLAHAPSAISSSTLTLTQLTWDTGLTTDPTLSADGKLLAYASDRAGTGNLDIYVQQVGGGDPLHLTHDPADEHQPSFSPDGTTVVFRSEKDGGGIYTVSALGGVSRRIAAGASYPRFSPDGRWIAYSGGSRLGFDRGGIYVVPSIGGEAKRMQPEFATAENPVWSPDGEQMLFLGAKRLGETLDWWVTPLKSGPATKTGALDAARRANLAGRTQVRQDTLVPNAWQPPSNWLVFSARSGDATNLWRVRISPKTSKVIGSPERLTAGPTLEDSPSIVSQPDGHVRLAFASLTEKINITSLRVELDAGRVIGESEPLTSNAATDLHPFVSPDGRKIVFVSARSGNQEIWVTELSSGQTSALTASRSRKWRPRFSPNGATIAFTELDTLNVYEMPSAGGIPELICRECGQITGWLLDGTRALVNALDGSIFLLDLKSRRKTQVLNRSGDFLADAFFSPDDRWIAFSDSTPFWRMYIVPFAGEHPIESSAWINIMEGHGGPAWSPDGNLVYDVSDRDGFLCLWSQRLDPQTKRPIGSPFPVFHAHNARISLRAGVEGSLLSAGHDRMFFEMTETNGNIWMQEWTDR